MGYEPRRGLGERPASDALASYCFHRNQLWPEESLFPVWRTELALSVRIRVLARLADLAKDAEIRSMQEGPRVT